jgi:hypothetical protein
MRSIAMTHFDWISFRRHSIGALALAALMASGLTASAQPREEQARIQAGIDEAIKALDARPRLKRLSAQKKKDLVEFVVGNIMFVMAHEMGHVVISELALPVLGREEDAADSFAVMTALKLHTAFSERVLIEAAKGWVLSSRRDKKDKTPLAFYDEHGLDLQRAYNVVCMMVGSDPHRFQGLAEESKLPEERQASCVQDYRNASWSWDLVLKPRRLAPDQPKTAIKVVHVDNEKFAVQAKILRDMGVLEAFAKHAEENFSWPRPFTIEARACEEPNAKWDVVTQTLLLCYELAQEFVELFVDYAHELPRSQKSKSAR